MSIAFCEWLILLQPLLCGQTGYQNGVQFRNVLPRTPTPLPHGARGFKRLLLPFSPEWEKGPGFEGNEIEIHPAQTMLDGEESGVNQDSYCSYCVTAPSDAGATSFAYFAITPLV